MIIQYTRLILSYWTDVEYLGVTCTYAFIYLFIYDIYWFIYLSTFYLFSETCTSCLHCPFKEPWNTVFFAKYVSVGRVSEVLKKYIFILWFLCCGQCTLLSQTACGTVTSVQQVRCNVTRCFRVTAFDNIKKEKTTTKKKYKDENVYVLVAVFDSHDFPFNQISKYRSLIFSVMN